MNSHFRPNYVFAGMRLRRNTGDSDSTASDSFLTTTVAALPSLQATRGPQACLRHLSDDDDSEAIALLPLDGDGLVTNGNDFDDDSNSTENSGIVVNFERGKLRRRPLFGVEEIKFATLYFLLFRKRTLPILI